MQVRQQQLLIFVGFFLWCATTAQQIQPRSTWTKRSTAHIPRLLGPAQYVIIHHTVTPPCFNQQHCSASLRGIQADHIRRKYGDIGYNFLIGSDGRIYEGLGFGLRGAHAPKYNSRSIGIAFIGNYQVVMPPAGMLQSTRQLIDLAVRTGRLQRSYILVGHCQTKSTQCPGRQLMNELKKWPHWQLG